MIEVVRRPVVAVGNSIGGYISASLAGDHPDLVSGAWQSTHTIVLDTFTELDLSVMLLAMTAFSCDVCVSGPELPRPIALMLCCGFKLSMVAYGACDCLWLRSAHDVTRCPQD